MAVLLADLVNLHDVGMLQAGDGFGLFTETSNLLGVGIFAGENHLERHEALEVDLAGLVNPSHPTAAQDAQDLITGDHGPFPIERPRWRR